MLDPEDKVNLPGVNVKRGSQAKYKCDMVHTLLLLMHNFF